MRTASARNVLNSLDSVIANEELSRRPRRAGTRVAVQDRLDALARELAASPRQVLQKMTDAALEVCRAGSAGVSLLEAEGGRAFFRWHAVSGAYAPLLWSTLPREFSPCGTVLDRCAAQLMVLPERHFTPLADIQPKVQEVLLVPFSVGGRIVGTLWVVSHEAGRRFDREDLRAATRLAQFAAQAYERLASLSADDVAQLSRLSAGRPQRAPRAAVQKRILVVDDNADAAAALAALLRAMGHEVFVAHEGRSALADLSKIRPDIALLDIAMPGMSGIELARQLRSRLGSALRIVALSGFGLPEDRARALEAGFDQHLVKPADAAFLRSLLG